jgi:hypothetical protein
MMTSRQSQNDVPLGSLILSVVAVWLVGCTHTVPIFDPLPEGTQVPVAVGVYYSAEFRTYQHTGVKGDRWVFPLGPASVTLFDQVFPRVFASTKPSSTTDR